MTLCFDQQANRDFIADSVWFSDVPDASLDRTTAASLPATVAGPTGVSTRLLCFEDPDGTTLELVQ